MIGRIAVFILGIVIIKYFLIFIGNPTVFASVSRMAVNAGQLAPELYLPEFLPDEGSTDNTTNDDGYDGPYRSTWQGFVRAPDSEKFAYAPDGGKFYRASDSNNFQYAPDDLSYVDNY